MPRIINSRILSSTSIYSWGQKLQPTSLVQQYTQQLHNSAVCCTSNSAIQGSAVKDSNEGSASNQNGTSSSSPSENEDSALASRFAQLTEDALESGGASTVSRTVAEAGFDKDLRRQLEERIASANLIKSTHPGAFAQVGAPKGAGKAALDIAGATPWTGTEPLADTALRMLSDAHKPLKARGVGPANPAVRLPTAPPAVRKTASSGSRIANARDRSSMYTSLKDSGMSAEEKDQMLNEMKARFQPTANNLPATLSGLASLANERIENAMARGQFKNLPRGKELETDYNANSPFIDTTEYFMNKMIKKQDIVPPWIEKQQELADAARRFRTRLRIDWKRHAARMIASAGGTLDQQVKRAEQFALAEKAVQARNSISQFSGDGGGERMSQISASGQLSSPKQVTEEKGSEDTAQSDQLPKVAPFRDNDWLSAERSFHQLSIDSLNSLARSYNLMAPQLAQKPYFNLERELQACFVDVAPLLPDEILTRASQTRPKFHVGPSFSSSSIIDRIASAPVRVYDEDIDVKGYGFRQFWKDIWKR